MLSVAVRPEAELGRKGEKRRAATGKTCCWSRDLREGRERESVLDDHVSEDTVPSTNSLHASRVHVFLSVELIDWISIR